jgi:hypothetical protein
VPAALEPDKIDKRIRKRQKADVPRRDTDTTLGNLKYVRIKLIIYVPETYIHMYIFLNPSPLQNPTLEFLI